MKLYDRSRRGRASLFLLSWLILDGVFASVSDIQRFPLHIPYRTSDLCLDPGYEIVVRTGSGAQNLLSLAPCIGAFFFLTIVPVFVWMGTLGFAVVETGRHRELRNRGRCEQCGYDLRATPDRCPECGRELPAEIRQMRVNDAVIAEALIHVTVNIGVPQQVARARGAFVNEDPPIHRKRRRELGTESANS